MNIAEIVGKDAKSYRDFKIDVKVLDSLAGIQLLENLERLTIICPPYHWDQPKDYWKLLSSQNIVQNLKELNIEYGDFYDTEYIANLESLEKLRL